MTEHTTEATLALGQDYPQIREAVRKLCDAYPAAYWQGLEGQPPQSSYPTEFIQALTQAGYLGALIPQEYGGAGLPLRAACVILEVIHSTAASAAAAHAQMYTMGTVLRHGSEAQKQHYLPKIAAGELRLQAFGVTEPNTGSDTTQLRTRATPIEGGYRVSGQKVWTSRAAHSDLMLLLARTTPVEECSKRTEGISTFLVDLREAVGNGCEIQPIEAMINHNTTQIFFDNLELPSAALIGEEGKGFRYILDGMNAERCLIGAEAIGNGRYFIERAVEYAGERIVFGKPIGTNQGVQFPIAHAHAQIEAADLMVRKSAALFDAGQPCGAAANMAKYLAAEASWLAAQACFDTFGGFAFACEYDIERKWRETRLFRTAPVSANMVLNYVAQHVLGMPRSY
ncbi:MAG: acyl-CoA dehydrogenase [Gammaproteobacteria bacterium]|nr:acyl-CoA dehydrogenase [Gammaproteobacteria bacterium]